MASERRVLAVGLPASPGWVNGKARVVKGRSQMFEFEDGEILVAESTPPEWVPLMRRAGGIVTDTGGITCHASIVSRELGIPCIVGTNAGGDAGTQSIRNGMHITVDAKKGIVYEGVVPADILSKA